MMIALAVVERNIKTVAEKINKDKVLYFAELYS